MYRRSRLAISSAVYAVFYSFCLYKNLGGATFPFFIIGTLCYIMFCTKEFGLTWKKDTTFFTVLVTLIGISHPLTDKTFIHVFNFIFAFTILIYIALHQFSYDVNWPFLKTLANLWGTVFGAFTKFFEPFKDWAEYNRRKKNENPDAPENLERKRKITVIVLTVVFTLPFLIIVTLILSSADYVFKKMLKTIFSYEIFVKIFENTDWLKVSLLTMFVFFFGYGLIVFLSKYPFSPEVKPEKKYDSLVAVTAGILFDLVYLVFSFIQIFFLFLGKLSLPAGVSYAEYARKGFFQLLFICMVNLILVLVGKSKFTDNRLLKIILTVMCGCTYIMTASSALRLVMYIRYYYFSFLRILAFWALAVVSVLLTGLLIHVWTSKVNLFKFSLRVILIAYTLLAFSHTDYFVVKLNMSQVESHSDFFVRDGYDDYNYIIRLTCLDSAPAVEEYDIKDKDLYYDFNNVHKDINVRNFNLSRYIAKQLVEKKD